MGLTHSTNTDTINWNNIDTNDMSSTIPNLNGISYDAEQLLSKLNLPEVSDTNSEFNSKFVFNRNINDQETINVNDQETINVNDQETINVNDASDNAASSPFISSEMYNYLVNKYTKNEDMVGGGKDDDDTSDTSSSSDALKESESESESESELESEPKPKPKSEKKGKNNKVINASSDRNYEGKKSKKSKNMKSKMYKGSETYLSYVSSSAHTGGSISETIPNENNYSISSVNTSDLNMISDN